MQINRRSALRILRFLRRRNPPRGLPVPVLFVNGVAIALASTFGLASSAAPSVNGIYRLQGQAIRIVDGDTFTLLSNGRHYKIRLASIDAPEIEQSEQRPGQPQGQASKRALSALISGKKIELVCFEQDHYGRDVCDVPLADGMTANQVLVAEGLAWANTEKNGKFMRDPLLYDLQKNARQSGKGIWNQQSPTEPWIWRYHCWKQGRC